MFSKNHRSYLPTVKTKQKQAGLLLFRFPVCVTFGQWYHGGTGGFRGNVIEVLKSCAACASQPHRDQALKLRYMLQSSVTWSSRVGLRTAGLSIMGCITSTSFHSQAKHLISFHQWLLQGSGARDSHGAYRWLDPSF